MHSWKDNLKTIKRRSTVAVAALAMAFSFGAYELVRPAVAAVGDSHSSKPLFASPAPALDDNSVGALLSLDQSMENLAARVTPAVVNVSVTSKANAHANDLGDQNSQDAPDSPFGNFGPFGFGQQPQQPQMEHGIGSGVIISPDGYIVTNNHVVKGAVNVRVTMSDRRTFDAKIVGTDPLTDLAVIKINAPNLASVPLGDSTKLRPGQTVLAFGNPMNFRFTVTRGIISALNRPNPDPTDRRKPGEFIQTDAAINPGNSGGPLVDARGQVIGINTFLVSDSGSFSGMGFAIPAQIVRPVVDQLVRNGKVDHGYVGIAINDVTPENSKFFNLTKSAGAVVSQVEPDSPGAKAGLKVGDVVTAIDGKPVNDAGELQVEVGERQPGTTIHLDLIRDGKHETMPVTLEAMGHHGETTRADNENGKPRWGVGLNDVTADVRQQLNLPANVNGAVVGNVVPGSSAEDAGLRPGDVI